MNCPKQATSLTVLIVLLGILISIPLLVCNPAQIFVDGCVSIDSVFSGRDFLSWFLQTLIIMVWVCLTVIGWALYGTTVLILLEEVLCQIEDVRGK